MGHARRSPSSSMCWRRTIFTTDAPYYYLTELAAKCTAKRLVPDYISEKKMKELKEGNCFPVMGCRSALTPVEGRKRQLQVLRPLQSGRGDAESGGCGAVLRRRHGEVLEDLRRAPGRCATRALMCRHNRLKGTLSDAAPILWQYGAIARLNKGEPIDKLLYGGYSTISLGYAGPVRVRAVYDGQVPHRSLAPRPSRWRSCAI